MRAIVCCATPVYPPLGGAPLRIWATIQWLQKFAETGVFSVAGKGSPPPGIAESAWCGAGATAQMDPPAVWMRHPDGLPSDGFFDAEAAAKLAQLVRDFRPDVAILETFFLHRYAPVLREAGVPMILNAHNVEIDVATQLETIERVGPIKLQRRRLAERLRRAEEALLREMDQIWVCSEEDGELMRQTYGVTAPIHFVPNAVNRTEYQTPSPQPAGLAGEAGPLLMFTGLFYYPPNLRAAEFLIHQLLPRISARYPSTRLLLPGAIPGPVLQQAAAQNPAVIVPGTVPLMLPYLQHSSIMTVPLTEGGGTRFKIIEAFSARLPVVSTAKGAEGLGAVPGTHYLAAETPEEFEAAVCRLLENRDFAQEMVERAADFAHQLWERAGSAMQASLESVRSGADSAHKTVQV